MSQPGPMGHKGFHWRSQITPIAVVCSWWLILRVIFFAGFTNTDDFAHIRFAYLWDRLPQDHLEARLLFNLLLRGASSVFGMSEWSWAVPGLVGSLALTLAVYFGARRLLGPAAAFPAACVAASFPVDVGFCTSAFATPPSSGVAAVSTVVLLTAQSGRRWLMAGLVGALAVALHPAAIFYFAALGAAIYFVVDRRGSFLYLLTVVLGYFAIDLAVNGLVTGDPWHALRILSTWHDPDANVELYSLEWFVFPVRTLFVSKAFGAAPAALLLWVFAMRPGRQPIERQTILAMALTVVFLWAWIGYGSAKPTSYEPFWRLTRFLHPLVFPLSLLFASWIITLGRWRHLALAGVCAVHFLLMASSGSYGRSPEISKEMLSFIVAHPGDRFIANSLTVRECVLLNGLVSIDNLGVATAETAEGSGIGQLYFLDNPLNRVNAIPNRESSRQDLAEVLSLGPTVFATERKPRLIAAFFPEAVLDKYPILIARPAGYIRPVLPGQEVVRQ